MPMFRRRRTHEDFSAELQAHLDLETDRLIAEGLGAYRPARRATRIDPSETLRAEA